MTSKLVVNTIESDTGISSVSFASSISMSSTSKFFFGAAGIDIGADLNINRPASGVLGFNINNSEKVRITSSGSVGIGTDAGLEDCLTLGGNGSVGASVICKNAATSYASGNGFYFGNGNGTVGYVWNYENDEIRFATNNIERLRIDAAGNMSLGKLNPASTNYGSNFQIHDSGTSGATLHLTTSQTGSSNSDGFHLVQQGAHIYHWNRESGGHQVFATEGIEKLRIDNDGHISQGGLTSPATTNGNIGRKFGIKSTANNIIIGETTQTGNGYGLHIESRQTGRSGNARIAQIGLKNDASGNGQISFFTSPSGADVSERLRILSNGHVAIGDDIANDTGMFKVIAADGQSDDQYVGQFKNLEATTNRNWGLLIQAGSSSTDESLRVRNYANNKDHLKIRGDGLITSESQCVFEVKLNGDQAFTSGTRFRLNFNYVANQQGTSFDTGNNRFTAPVAGYYQFNVGVYSYYSHFMELDGRCNGASTGAKTYRPTTRASSGNDTNPGASIMASWVVKLAQGDYYEIYCLINSGSGVKNVYSDLNRTPTWWSGFLIC